MRRCLWLVLFVCGCSEELVEGRKEVVPMDKVPPAVMKAAQDKLPEIKFDNVWKTKKGIYEVRGKAKNGKIQEVEVTETGEVLLVE